MADLAGPIVFERIIDVTVDEAFALFTEPERLRRWQAISASVDLRVGGDYRLTVVPGSIAYGTYTEIEPGKRLVYTWGWKGDDMPLPSESRIAVDFESLGEQTKVTMTHSGLDEEAAASHTVGWNHFFERLERAAETGDAGLNMWGMDGDEFDLLTMAEASWAICRKVLTSFGPDSSRDDLTPCDGYTTHDLVEHLMGSLKGIGSMAGADMPDDMKGANAEDYIAQAADLALTAWRERGTDGTVPFGEGEAPATMMAGILSLEFLVHAWDFAQADGQQLDVPPGLVAAVQAQAETIIQPEYRGEGKGFGAETVPSSDDPMVVLAAFTGRAT